MYFFFFSDSPSFAISRVPGFGFPIREGIPVSLKCDVDSNPPSSPVWQKGKFPFYGKPKVLFSFLFRPIPNHASGFIPLFLSSRHVLRSEYKSPRNFENIWRVWRISLHLSTFSLPTPPHPLSRPFLSSSVLLVKLYRTEENWMGIKESGTQSKMQFVFAPAITKNALNFLLTENWKTIIEIYGFES